MRHPIPSLSRREFLAMSGAAGAGMVVDLGTVAAASPTTPAAPSPQPGQRRAFGLRCPPLSKVRIGFIGMGGRGMSLLGNLLDLDRVEIRAVCDILPDRVQRAQQRVVARGQPEPAGYAKDEVDFERLCGRDDLDLIYVATPWDWHVPMALSALRQGKHAAVEVPAAMTLEECWQLVDAVELTRRHLFMLENCCYGEIELLVLRMAHEGVFGHLIHAEAGYLHEAREYLLRNSDGANWRRRFMATLDGNLYPTHGLGPVALDLDIHAGDRFEYLVSMSSRELGLSRQRDELPDADPRRRERFACGDFNTSLLRTALGRTIVVQYSMVVPRPYSRINLISGTRGTFADYPPRLHLEGQAEDWVTELQSFHDRYGHPLWKELHAQARKSGGHGGMDYVMNWRLIQCLLEGWPLDLTVYDAAAWSSIVPLSIESVSRSSAPVAIPDFTRGGWIDQPPSALATARSPASSDSSG